LIERGHEVSGVDTRPWPDPPKKLEMYQVDIRKRAAEDVFRRKRPDAVVHMATVNALTLSGEERYRINLGGTQAVFQHCRAHGVKQMVFVGRHTYYGAGADSPLYHTEGEPPLALAGYPELADLVAADLFAASAIWRYPDLATTILRLCYTLGPTGHGTLAGYLRSRRVPRVLGFDPLFQFLHEDDAASAIVLALEKGARGVYNVAGPAPLPVSFLIERLRRKELALPEPFIKLLLGRVGFPSLPVGALNHLKYPIVVDASLFRQTTGFEYQFDEVRTLRDFERAFPVPS
jgi:UDP-glucose 4-epimerase